MVFSAHDFRLGSNLFIGLQAGYYPFSVLLRVYESLFHNFVQSNVKPCSRFKFSHILYMAATKAFHFLYSSLLD